MRRELQRWNKELAEPGEFHAGQWISFSDANGRGLAQPDIFIVFPKLILLIEVKLTQVPAAERQLHSLYRPLLRLIYQRPVVCVEACRYLTTFDLPLIRHPKEMIETPRRGTYIWHFMG